MNPEILDSEFTFKEEKKQTKFIQWLSLIILWIGIISFGFFGLFDISKSIAAIVLLLLATYLSFSNFKLGIKVTFGIILLGIFNLIDFFPYKYFIAFKIIGLKFNLEIILFGIGLIHFFTNRKILSGFLRKLSGSEVSPKEIHVAKRSKINGFKKRFSKKEIAELEMIIQNKKLVPEAIEAARELLEEKKLD